MSTRETVESYYKGIAQKKGWESLISDDIKFGGTGVKSTEGKAAYVEATNGFLRAVKTLEVKELIVEGDKAAAIVHYELTSPKRNRLAAQVGEFWSVKNDKMDSSAIFFDTVAFRDFMSQG